ncbi:MAG: GNAT family N-acetyltransferase [Chthoniobacterales bacterium]|nr:GNAT family N-acetyltransferase [Chthoniobacterales bacterium]
MASCLISEGTITTRAFEIADYEAAVRLWSEIDGVEVAEGDCRDDIARFISRNPQLSPVAEAGSVIVGAALCGHDGRRGHIYHLAVEPAYQRLGVGKRLVDECLVGLRAAGIERVIILVAADNARGRAFWRRAGWEDISGAAAMGIDL